MKNIVFALMAGLVVTACATPEARVRTGLVSAGISSPMAACMAKRMVGKLSLLQLRRLGSLGNFKGEAIRDMSVERVLRNVRALNDPQIISVTTSAAIGCAISA